MHFQAGYYVVNRRYIKRVCPFKNSLTLGVKIPLTLLNVSLISVWRQCYSTSCEKLFQSHLWQYFISLNLTSVQLLWMEENYNNNIRRVLLLSETCSKIRKYSSQKFFLCILLKIHPGNAVYTDLFSFRYWMLFSSTFVLFPCRLIHMLWCPWGVSQIAPIMQYTESLTLPPNLQTTTITHSQINRRMTKGEIQLLHFCDHNTISEGVRTKCITLDRWVSWVERSGFVAGYTLK